MNWYDASKLGIDLNLVTMDQWQEISDRMNALGYEFRGAEDAKKLFTRTPKLSEDEIKVYRAVVGKEDYVDKKDSKQTRSIFNKAIRYFGITHDLKEAGYILPNGTLLDLSGKKQGGTPGTRSLDHREIQFIEIDMPAFIKMGVIRRFPEMPGADIRAKPTQIQLDIIQSDVDNSANGYDLELFDNRSGRFHNQYEVGTKGSKVINDIVKFYSKYAK